MTEQDRKFKARVEPAAVAIFAAMQANPNWVDSKSHETEAVRMALSLIAEIDRQFSANGDLK